MQERPIAVRLLLEDRRPSFVVLSLMVWFSWTACQPANAGFVFSFAKVIDSNQLPNNPVVLNNIDVVPQVNNSKQVALLLRQSSNGIQGGNTNSNTIYRWNAGSLTRIAGSGDIVPSNGAIQFLGRPALSDTGSIGFRSTYTPSGGGVVRVGGTSSMIQPLSSDTNSLNPIGMNSNDRLITGNRPSTPVNAPYDVVSWDVNGNSTLHASNASSGAFSSFSQGNLPAPDINNLDQVSLRAQLRSNNRDGVYIVSSGGIQPIADDSSFVFTSNITDINNNGSVVFGARSFSNPAGTVNLYKGGVGMTTTLFASQSDYTSIAASGFAINDSGNIFFMAIKDGSNAIYSGNNPAMDRVIGTGDTLDGGKIVELNFGRGMLNNNNDIVFYTLLDDNNDGIADRSGVFLGSVTAAPEPTSLLLCAFCGMAAIRKTCRNRLQARNS